MEIKKETASNSYRSLSFGAALMKGVFSTLFKEWVNNINKDEIIDVKEKEKDKKD